MKTKFYSLLFLLLAITFLPQFISAQDYPLTMTPGEGANVNLSLAGDELTISMTSRDYPANSAVYKLNICDINYVGGDMASYDYSYTKYYFLKVSFALKKGGRYKVIQPSSAPYYAERPLNYVNAVDGNSVGVNEPCTEFDGAWKKINDESCNTIMVILQAFKDDVNRLYEWRNMLLKRLQACGTGKIVYKEFCFSCRDERFVHSNNSGFQPHLNDCDDRERSVPFDTQEEMNDFHYEVLTLDNKVIRNGNRVGATQQNEGLSSQQLFERGNKYYVSKDYQLAAEWFRKAAEQGNADAQTNLGFMYESGQGVTKDDAEAVRWFRKAADQGFAQALFPLGLMYESGWGVTEDKNEAIKWYKLAAAQGIEYAKQRLKKLGVSGY